MADEPVPITPTLSPVKSTPSFGHSPVCQTGPLKSAMPANGGLLADDRQPTAIRQKRASTRSPRSVSTTQRAFASSKVAAVTRVENRMSRLRSKRSATWLA